MENVREILSLLVASHIEPCDSLEQNFCSCGYESAEGVASCAGQDGLEWGSLCPNGVGCMGRCNLSSREG